MTVVLPKELLEELRELARIETGPLPVRGNGDMHTNVVLRRLIREYVEQKKREAASPVHS